MSEGGQQQPPLEIQVVDWNADTNTITIEGMNPQLEELLLTQRIAPSILLPPSLCNLALHKNLPSKKKKKVMSAYADCVKYSCHLYCYYLAGFVLSDWMQDWQALIRSFV